MRNQWPNAEFTSVDKSREFEPDICTDILEWDYKHRSTGYYQVIWASPPCEKYSRASGKNNVLEADKTARRVFEIIEYYTPVAWFVENPATGYMHTREWIQPYNVYLNDCTYCMYGTLYQKKTHIWSNVPVTLRCCRHGDRCPHFVTGENGKGFHPMTAQKGPSRSGGIIIPGAPTKQLWRVPERLVRQLCHAANL